MNRILTNAAILFISMPVWVTAQDTKYLAEKNGKWSLYNNIQEKTAEFTAYNKNVTAIAEWFHHKIPLLATPKGFDLNTTIFGMWDDNYKKRACNYAIRSQLVFNFELFLVENGKESKWVVEPPHWSFYINNTHAGHGTNFYYEGYKVQDDPPALEAPFEKATATLADLFAVFPFEKEIASGVHLYGNGNLVIFNPDRPPFWVPVTVKEVMDMKLTYYSIRPSEKEILYTYLKKAYDEMSTEELNAPAYYGSEDGIVQVNGKKEGLQIMKFNKDYWDRSLPASAIQLICMYYSSNNDEEMQEYMKNNKHPNYAQLVKNAIPLNELAGLIQKKE